MDLAHILHWGQLVRVVGLDSAHPRTDGEGDLDHLVESRLVSSGAQPTIVGLAVHGPQADAGLQNGAATWAEDVPGHVEDADLCRMQESRDHKRFVESLLCGH